MSTEFVRRFTRWQIFEHLNVMIVFTLLCVTGLPQKYFDAAWARWMIDVLGGVDRVQAIHRVCGIIFAVSSILHIFNAIASAVRHHERLAIAPTKKDLTDLVTQLRYYLGATAKPAQFDRYDYRQKFEYWGMAVGTIVMIFTGLILYVPALATRILPGELVPAAKVMHSNEGLLAFLVIIIWHLFNAHLSPDVFPYDGSIFTGKISRERMLHEHPLELARLEHAEPKDVETEAPPGPKAPAGASHG